ncbi:translation elongation factor Ts [Limnochorda pilosa]|uniref:Elongation factor Ts n=1 Tax=Limnochorda pilosa TaxID=1555112 RepID=A0A0K2SK81_LIMPI|nr:translation elongation factor Ts [Limnochorda pilosa]BAS27523.1 elongation factor Ts [Limnochorda pilosa]
MPEVTATLVKELRERTGAGMMDCKQALTQAGGNMEEATRILREKGLAQAAKRAGRVASEGLVDAYIHGDGRIGVLIEVNCETDFVAKTEAFRTLARDLAMQVAAARPDYVRREDVPAGVVERERDIYRAAARNEGKPEHVLDKIVSGRLEKFYQERCLLEQPFVKDPDRSVGQLVQEVAARLGENVTVRRFARFERGEGVSPAANGEA